MLTVVVRKRNDRALDVRKLWIVIIIEYNVTKIPLEFITSRTMFAMVYM